MQVALGELYRFYAAIEPMMSNVLRDAEVLPLVRREAQSCLDFVDEVAFSLAEAVAPGRSVAVVAVRHAVDFRTWQSLVNRGGLEPEEAVALMGAMVESVAVDTR